MVDDRAFGAAGRTRCIEDCRRAFRGEVRQRWRLAEWELFDGYHAPAERLHDRRPLRVGYHESRFCIRDDMFGLGRAVLGIHEHHAGARPLHAEEADDPVERARRVDGDPVAGLDAKTAKSAGQPLRVLA